MSGKSVFNLPRLIVPMDDLLILARVEQARTIFTGQFGFIHGLISMPQQGIRVGVIQGIERYAAAGADIDRLSFDKIRFCNCLMNALYGLLALLQRMNIQQ